MIVIVRDTWRAVLVIVVVTVLRGLPAERPAAPTVATTMPPSRQMPWQPPPPPPPPQPQPQQIVIHQQPQPPERPLRRVAAALTEVGDSVIGVFR
jgi:hypothetical protein